MIFVKSRKNICCSLCATFSCDCGPEEDCRRPLTEEEEREIAAYPKPTFKDFAMSVRITREQIANPLQIWPKSIIDPK